MKTLTKALLCGAVAGLSMPVLKTDGMVLYQQDWQTYFDILKEPQIIIGTLGFTGLLYYLGCGNTKKE